MQHNTSKLKEVVVPTLTTDKLLIDFIKSKDILNATYFVSKNNNRVFTQFEVIYDENIPLFKALKYGKNTTLLYKRGENNGIYSLINTLGDGINTEYNVALDRDYVQDSIYKDNMIEVPNELLYISTEKDNISNISNVDKKTESLVSMTLLKNIQKTSSTANKELIDRMLQIPSLNSVSVVYETQPKVDGMSVNGYYNPDTNTIILKGSLNSALMEETTIHESIHSILISAIDNPTEAQTPYVNRLKNILKYYNENITLEDLKKAFPNVKPELLQTVFIDRMKTQDGIHEFIAYTMSNERFRGYLKSRNVLEKIYNYIKEILKSSFNIQKDELNLLNSIESNIFAIMDNIIETSVTPTSTTKSGMSPISTEQVNISDDKITNGVNTLTFPDIKKEVLGLFKSNSELQSIGTIEQYSQYLDTIFPDYIDNFAYEAVEELLVANKIIDRKC